jgi:hypothetical protein
MVLGFDGTEQETIAKYNTFCNLCSKEIYQNEQAITWPGKKFLIHPDCQDPEIRKRRTIMEFKKNSKKKRTSVKQGTVKGKLSSPGQSRKNWN